MYRSISAFITPEKYLEIKRPDSQDPGWLLFVACTAGIELAEGVKKDYEALLNSMGSSVAEVSLLARNEEGGSITRRYPDGETCPRLPQSVDGSDAYIFQNTLNRCTPESTNDNLQQLIQMVATLKSNGAKRVTVVWPYHSYCRQEKETYLQREPISSALVAKQLLAVGMDALLTYHLHTDAVKAPYHPARVIALSGLDVMVGAFKAFRGREDVVSVSTDGGGSDFSRHFAEALGIDYRPSSKYRSASGNVTTVGPPGSFKGKKIAVIVDDETVTTTSLLNPAKILYNEHGLGEIYGFISHLKINEDIIERLEDAHNNYGLKMLHTTDSVPQPDTITGLPFIEVHPLSQIWALVINRLHYGYSLKEVFHKPN